MKISKLVLCLCCVVILTTSCKDKTATTGATEQSTSANANSVHPKIVYVNIDTLLAKYDLYIEKKKELEGQSAAAEKNITGKIESFQKRLGNFQKEVYETQQRAGNISPVDLKKIQEEFGRREQTLASEESALVKQRDAAAADLDKKLSDLQIKLKENIDNYLGKIAKERDYDYILSKGLGQSVLFGRESFDITKEAVATMNEDYAKTKGGK